MWYNQRYIDFLVERWKWGMKQKSFFETCSKYDGESLLRKLFCGYFPFLYIEVYQLWLSLLSWRIFFYPIHSMSETLETFSIICLPLYIYIWNIFNYFLALLYIFFYNFTSFKFISNVKSGSALISVLVWWSEWDLES